jgi:nucleotide-binding universal stress UspA family protein
MSLKNLLVAYNGSDSTNTALTTALQMAEKFDAHLTGVLAHGGLRVHSSAGPWITQEIRELIARSAQEACAGIAKAFDERVARLERKDKIHWLDISGETDASVMQCAHFFDLIVMGQYEDMEDEQYLALHPEVIAQQSGKPVIIVPKSHKAESPIAHAIVAWDGRRTSARALSDAMPIVETVPEVTVVSVGDLGGKSTTQLDIVTHLERHGVSAKHVTLERAGTIGDTILMYCEEVDAGLLVMGAYEHSKLGEDILGGVTNQIIKTATLPVLMSH